MDDLDALLDLEGAAFCDDDDEGVFEDDDVGGNRAASPVKKRPLEEADANVASARGVVNDPAAKRPRAAGEQQPEDDEEEEEDELMAMLATQVDVAPSAALPPPPPQAVETEKEARGEKEAAAVEEEEAPSDLPVPLPPPPALLHPFKAAGDVTNGEAFPVTSDASGERVYLTFGPPHVRGALSEAAAAVERSKNATSSSSSRSSSQKGLLSAPLAMLQDQAERDALERALAAVEDRDMQEAAKAAAARSSAAASASAAAPTPPPRSLLWVDKYAPRSFMELLSDEQVNKEVLRWVKSWHEVVFGNGNQQRNSFNGGAGASGGDGRPEHKILLLAGPPGLGKTTLAHVVARHCGYLPIEINASDERSATALQARVRDATEMAAGGGLVPGKDGGRRPACVIVDEVDGAAGGPEGRSAVTALLRIVQATGAKAKGKKKGNVAAAAPSKRDDGESDDDSDREGEGEASAAAAAASSSKNASKKGSSGPGRLLRPIIAICNDAFAPALRPLRSVALVVHIRPPATARLISRLKAVCTSENVQADRRALVAVAESSGRDVRSCLHGLQLLAGRSLAASARARAAAAASAEGGGGDALASSSAAAAPPPRVITFDAASRLRSGAKDAKQSAFDVWGALLHAGAPRVGGGSVAARSAAAAAASASSKGKATNQQQHRTASSLLWESVSDFGDSDLLLRGLHESLPRLRLADGRANRLAAATEALAAADAAATRGVAGAGTASGDWALAAFAPLSLLRFRAAVAGPDRPRVAWPTLFADAERGRAANAAALSLWSRSLPAGLRASGTAACSSKSLVSDVAPALLRVASAPGTRPVAHHLLSRAESEALTSTVATLAAYNLTYSPRTAKDSFGGSFSAASFGRRDGFGNNNGNANAPLAVGGPAAAFAAAFAAAAESGAYGGSMMMITNQQRQPTLALASASSLASSGSLASSSSSSLPSGVGFGPSAPLKEGDLDLFPTVLSDVVSFGLGRARAGAALPQPARALLASEVAQEVIRRREAAFAEKSGPAAAGAGLQQRPKGGAGDRRVSLAGGTGATTASAAPVPLTLAERAAQSGAAARAALAAQQERERKGTWLDQIRGRASKRRAGELAAAAVRAAASVAETQERQMAASTAAAGGGRGEIAAVEDQQLSPEAAARKAAAPKAVYRFNEGYTNAVRRPVRVREML